jgi:hypothetical protein
VTFCRAGEGDGGESDIDEVEFLAERFDDATEPLEVVADEGFAEVRPEDVELSLA